MGVGRASGVLAGRVKGKELDGIAGAASGEYTDGVNAAAADDDSVATADKIVVVDPPAELD